MRAPQPSAEPSGSSNPRSPEGAELLVGNIMASADDVVDRFRRHARKLEQGT